MHEKDYNRNIRLHTLFFIFHQSSLVNLPEELVNEIPTSKVFS